MSHIYKPPWVFSLEPQHRSEQPFFFLLVHPTGLLPHYFDYGTVPPANHYTTFVGYAFSLNFKHF
jgi:hypothetical protein